MAGKEWIQVRRDSRSLILSLLAPVFLVLLFGYALNMDVKNVAIAVLDMDRSSTSRQFIEGFAHNEYLTIHSYAENYGDLDGLLDSGAAALALVIPTGFARRLNSEGTPISSSSWTIRFHVRYGLRRYVARHGGPVQPGRQILGLAGSGIISFRQPVAVRSRSGTTRSWRAVISSYRD
jgi:hypothetical protein